MTTAMECTLARTATDLIDALLASYPSSLPEQGRLRRWKRLRALLLRRHLRKVRSLVERALADARALAAVGKSGDPFGSMQHVIQATEDYLLTKLKGFHVSPEYWACARLFSAAPRQARRARADHARRATRAPCRFALVRTHPARLVRPRPVLGR